MYDVADTVLAQRISQVPGVGEVNVSGADQPAVRIALNPVALSNAGIATDDVRLAIVQANPLGPAGIFNGDRQSETIAINKQMRTAAEFRDIIIKSSGRQFRAAVRCRRHRGFRAQQPLDRLVQPAAGGADPDHQAGRRQRDRDRRSRAGADPGIEAVDSGRRRNLDPGRPHRHDPRQRAGHAVHAAGDRVPGDVRGVPVPAPDHADHCRRRLGAAGAGRHLRRACGSPASRSTICR